MAVLEFKSGSPGSFEGFLTACFFSYWGFLAGGCGVFAEWRCCGVYTEKFLSF